MGFSESFCPLGQKGPYFEKKTIPNHMMTLIQWITKMSKTFTVGFVKPYQVALQVCLMSVPLHINNQLTIKCG
jgi:hypothetical protein